MSDHPEQGSGAADLAAQRQGCGGGEGGSSAIPGHHPGALAAVASSAGLAGGGVKGVAGNWDPGNPEKDQSLLPNERKLRLGIDSRNDYKSCVLDIELGATVTANTFETGAATQSGVLGGGPDTRYCGSGSAGDGAGAVGNLDASSPATPEGDAISRRAAVAAAEVFNGPASDSQFCMGQSTAAQQIIATLRSLPPQDGEREQIERLTSDLQAMSEACGAHHVAAMNEAGLRMKAEAERDAIAAAAFEAAAEIPLQWLEQYPHSETRKSIALSIRALAPVDAKSALDAMIEAAAMTECAAFSAGYEAGERAGKPAALTAQPVALSSELTEGRADHVHGQAAVDHAPAQPVAQEPVAWTSRAGLIAISEGRSGWMFPAREGDDLSGAIPLYAHPATPAPVEAGLELPIVAGPRAGDPALGHGDMVEAFMAGAFTVHDEWQRAHAAGEGPPRGDPEFREAATDWADGYASRYLENARNLADGTDGAITVRIGQRFARQLLEMAGEEVREWPLEAVYVRDLEDMISQIRAQSAPVGGEVKG